MAGWTPGSIISGFTGGSTASTGILSKLTGSGGILSMGPLQGRLAGIQAAATPQAKLQALTGTLGTRLKTLNLGGSGTSTFRGPFGLINAGGPKHFAAPFPQGTHPTPGSSTAAKYVNAGILSFL